MDPDTPIDSSRLDSDRLDPWVWAFLGEFPAAGLALRPTLRAWEEVRRRQTAADDAGLTMPADRA